jgi:hypothetical protein
MQSKVEQKSSKKSTARSFNDAFEVPQKADAGVRHHPAMQHNDALAFDPMHPTLFTLGYEGLTIGAFIARLQAAQVKTMVDVRELQLSRKKGVSKSAFCIGLSAHGLAYLQASALGCRKPIRNQYKADGNWQTYTRDFFKPVGRANDDASDR